MDEYFPVTEGYHIMTVDGWWYNHNTRKVIVLDSRSYANSKDGSLQKQRLGELNCNSFRLKCPSGDSPAYSETIVEECNQTGRVDTFTEKELIEFLRRETGNPISSRDFPIVGPYTLYNSVRWENRSRYVCNNQFLQWIRTPPQLCSVHHGCMFYDIRLFKGSGRLLRFLQFFKFVKTPLFCV